MYAIFLLYMKKPCATSTPPVPLQEAHRPDMLKLRHRPTSVQDVPTCEPQARTDFEPKAHHVKESNHCITDTEI